jgi:hypothetical protein
MIRAGLLLGILATLVTSVRAGQAAFEEYLKHHQGQEILLPRLYEPQPKYVPMESTEKLIRLWESHAGSAILRNAGSEIRLYEGLLAERDQDPARFDREHPTVGWLFSNPEFFDYAMYLYHLDRRRFVHYHPHLIPVLRGEAMMMMAPRSQTMAPETISVPPVASVPVGIRYTRPLPAQSLTIPEPSSIVSLALAIGLLGAGLWARRRWGGRGRTDTPR